MFHSLFIKYYLEPCLSWISPTKITPKQNKDLFKDDLRLKQNIHFVISNNKDKTQSLSSIGNFQIDFNPWLDLGKHGVDEQQDVSGSCVSPGSTSGTIVEAVVDEDVTIWAETLAATSALVDLSVAERWNSMEREAEKLNQETRVNNLKLVDSWQSNALELFSDNHSNENVTRTHAALFGHLLTSVAVPVVIITT